MYINKKVLLRTYKFVLLFLAVCAGTQARALDTLLIKENFTEVNIEDFGYLYIEETYELNFEKIQALPDDAFHPVRETGIYFNAEEKLYWLKFQVKNTTNQEVNLFFVGRNITLNRTQFFQEDVNGNVSASRLTGDAFSFSSRDIQHRFLLYEVRIPAGETKTCYSFIDKYRNSLWLKFDLEDRNLFFQKDKMVVFFEAMYFGALLTISCVVFVLWCFNRRDFFLYLTLYCLVSTLWIYYWLGYGFMFLWYKFPFLNNYMAYFCSILHSILLVAMARSYLQTRKHLPVGDKLLKYIQSFFWFFFVVNIFVHLLPPEIRMSLVRLSYFVQLSYLFIVAAITIMSYLKSGQKQQLIFLTAFGFTFLALIILPLQHLEVIDDQIIPRYTMHWLFGLDIITLVWLMALRVKDIILKKVQLEQKISVLKVQAASALIEGQQQERQRLSMNLHDGLSLKLATVKMRLSNVFIKTSKEEQVQEVDNLLQELGNVSDDLRNFTHELSPLDLQEQSLQEAIEDLIYKIEKASKTIQIDLTCNEKIETTLSDLQCYVIYQVIQELLNNVLKHAEATKVEVGIGHHSKTVIVSVQDNGKGVDFATKKEGIGLKNIRLRADFLSGDFQVISEKIGSQFVFSFPQSD